MSDEPNESRRSVSRSPLSTYAVAVFADTHTLPTRPKVTDSAMAFKKVKHNEPHEEGPETSKSNEDKLRKAGLPELDLSSCNSEREAKQHINDFWEPAPLGLSTTTPIPSRSEFKPSQSPKDDHSPRPSKEEAQYSRLTPERSSSPQSNDSTSAYISKEPAYQMPTTPESLPQDGHGSSEETTPTELSDRLSRLFSLEEQEGDSALASSCYTIQKRIQLAKDRKVKERKEAMLAARKLRLHRRQPHKKLIQSLKYEWNDTVDLTIRSNDHGRIITTSMGGTELRLKDFATLLGKHAWLNDEIINTYVEWVVVAANKAAIAEAKEFEEPTSTVPKFIAHNSFFYQNLIKKGPSSTTGLMRRKKAPGPSLLEVDSVFVPICKGAHWTVGVVRPIAKTIEYFDSMGGNSSHFIKLMREWLRFQLGDKYVESEWSTPDTACAHQSNGYDCGVFVCTNAFCVAAGLDTSCYDECDMLQQRRNIAAVLMNRGFLGDFAWNEAGL